MIRNYKEILLKDLSARMPYGLKCNVGEEMPYTLSRIEVDDLNGHLLDFIETKDGLDMQVYLSEAKPYLYPLSSMTEEQCEEFRQVSGLDADLDSIRHGRVLLIGDRDIAIDCLYDAIDWFNKNHFDYRELIPLGLAIDATGLGIYDR